MKLMYYVQTALVAAFMSVAVLMWNAHYNVFHNTNDLLMLVSVSWIIAFILQIIFPVKTKEK